MLNSVLHSMKQGINSLLTRTFTSLAAWSWKRKKHSVFLAPSTSVPPHSALKISINTSDNFPCLQHDWGQSCATRWARRTHCGCPSQHGHQLSLGLRLPISRAGRRLLQALYQQFIPKPATLPAPTHSPPHPRFHSLPHSWWWTLSHPGNLPVLLLLPQTRQHVCLCPRATRTDTYRTAYSGPANMGVNLWVCAGSQALQTNTCSRKTR